MKNRICLICCNQDKNHAFDIDYFCFWYSSDFLDVLLKSLAFLFRYILWVFLLVIKSSLKSATTFLKLEKVHRKLENQRNSLTSLIKWSNLFPLVNQPMTIMQERNCIFYNDDPSIEVPLSNTCQASVPFCSFTYQPATAWAHYKL